jgi:hypothetical protein
LNQEQPVEELGTEHTIAKRHPSAAMRR